MGECGSNSEVGFRVSDALLGCLFEELIERRRNLKGTVVVACQKIIMQADCMPSYSL